jgi:hypothetical protein
MQPWATLNPFWVSNKAFLRKSPFLFFGVKWVLTPGRVVPTADLPSGSSAWCRRSYSCRISGRPVSSPGTAIACSPDPGISYSEPTPHGICLDPCGGSLLSVGPGNRWSLRFVSSDAGSEEGREDHHILGGMDQPGPGKTSGLNHGFCQEPAQKPRQKYARDSPGSSIKVHSAEQSP